MTIQPIEGLKLCADCRWCMKNHKEPKFWNCACPLATSNQKTLPVNGKLILEAYCTVERQYTCGKDAKWFIEKEPEPIEVREVTCAALNPPTQEPSAFVKLLHRLIYKPIP